MDNLTHLIPTLCINALPLLFAITLHEAAHGYAARYFGDNTAWQMGRVSLNPAHHIDPFGTILLPLLMALTGSGILFGWAKPVPVNFGRLRKPKQHMLWVALAGPAANLAMALGWAVLCKAAQTAPANAFTEPMTLMGIAGVQWNLMLMVFNLLPVPPLDGGRVLESLLPLRQAMALARLERYGFIIVLALALTHVLGAILTPPIQLCLDVINRVFAF